MKNLIIALLVVLSIGFQEAYGQGRDIPAEVEYKNEAGDIWSGPQLYYRDLENCTYMKVQNFPIITCAEYADKLYTGYKNNGRWFYFGYADSVPTWLWYETKPIELAHNGRWSSNSYRYCRPSRPNIQRHFGIGWTSGYYGGHGGYGRLASNFGMNVGWGNQFNTWTTQPNPWILNQQSQWNQNPWGWRGGAYGGGSPYDYRTRPAYQNWAWNDPWYGAPSQFVWGW